MHEPDATYICSSVHLSEHLICLIFLLVLSWLSLLFLSRQGTGIVCVGRCLRTGISTVRRSHVLSRDKQCVTSSSGVKRRSASLSSVISKCVFCSSREQCVWGQPHTVSKPISIKMNHSGITSTSGKLWPFNSNACSPFSWHRKQRWREESRRSSSPRCSTSTETPAWSANRERRSQRATDNM